jgi:hypothetical protein
MDKLWYVVIESIEPTRPCFFLVQKDIVGGNGSRAQAFPLEDDVANLPIFWASNFGISGKWLRFNTRRWNNAGLTSVAIQGFLCPLFWTLRDKPTFQT